jgi:AraC family transcriptional regulator, regulatory protein of adaptative response / methylated-DNA-[protein]-cysteine methyltransferase
MVASVDTKETAVATAEDPRWPRVVARDRTADGQFWYAVATTGIYCRPSCPSRTANPKNVTLYDTLAAVRASGFRPCKRCRPDGVSLETENTERVARACRLIDQSEELPSLAELAEAAGFSASYFHRQFKVVTGLTPKAYGAARQAERVRERLARGQSVTATIYEAGFTSSGRFYEKAQGILGMTPSKYRAGAPDEDIRFAVGQSSLGAILAASSARGVVAILIGDDPEALVRDLQDRFPRARLVGGDGDYERVVAEVIGLIEAPAIGLDLPLDVRGTVFQQRVWQVLRKIPPGKTASYAEVARAIGAPEATRAVAGACAANAIAVAIPCHRVVRTDGSLSGYAWGIERKRALIERELAA